MVRTIIITEAQEKMLRAYVKSQLIKEDGIASLKQEECTEMPEHISTDEQGSAGTVAGRFRPLPMTDKVAKEVSVPDFDRFGKYVNGY